MTVCDALPDTVKVYLWCDGDPTPSLVWARWITAYDIYPDQQTRVTDPITGIRILLGGGW